MPSQFSASTPSSESDILVDCSDGCQDLNFPTTLTGYTALIRLVVGDASTCSVSSRVARAKQKGATAVVLANHLEGEVPYPLSWEYTDLLPTVPDRTSSSNGINMAVCLLSYTDAQAILQPVLKSRRRLPSSDRNTYTQTIEWTKFERWDRANEPSTGQHTVLSILSPMSIKDDWPAAQASFNPKVLPAVSADVIHAQWTDECLPQPRGESQFLSYYCGKCWKTSTKFKNQKTIQNNIVLYTRPYSICYPYFYDLAFTGQNAGASGVVAALGNNKLPVYLAPHLIPYRMTSPLLAIQSTVGKLFKATQEQCSCNCR